jgi:hypothetical protein
MSHFTSIQTHVRDIAALRDACAELGVEVHENARARGYNLNNLSGEYVIKLKGPYDIALNKQPDGTFAMTTDWWNGHVEKEAGTGFGKLMQLYAVHKASREARRKGYSIQRKAQRDGSIKLCIGGV